MARTLSKVVAFQNFKSHPNLQGSSPLAEKLKNKSPYKFPLYLFKLLIA